MVKKKKILFLTRSFYPNIGGVEKHVFELSKELIKRDYGITILTERIYSKNYYPKLLINGNKGAILEIGVVRIDAGGEDWFKKFRVWRELIKNIKLISKSDIVHCHDVFFWYLPFKFIFPFKKVYTTFHGYEGNKIPRIKAIFMHKLAEKLSNGNICVGKFLKKWYRTKPTLITYGAIDKSILNLQTTNTKDIVFAGRLVEETGIMKYLKAMLILKDKNYKLRLDIYGEGNLRKKAEEFVKKHNLNVSFKGFKMDIEKYLKDYKCVFVSRYLGILEVLALRKNVIAEYNNEIKKDYLYMSPFAKYISIVQTPEEIAKELEKYIKNPKNRNVNSYKWVENQTWENMAKIYIKLWGF